MSESTVSEQDVTALSPWRLLWTTLVLLVVLMFGIAALAYWLREPLLLVSRAFVSTLGGLGVALGFFLADAFTLPLPNDVCSLLGLVGGLSFWEVVFWGTLGSLAGGGTGFWLGRWLRKTAWLQSFFEKRGRQVEPLLRRYGLVAVAVAAITPLPYSIFCWAAGAGGIGFVRFMGVTLLRVFRVAGYLYLVELGLLATQL